MYRSAIQYYQRRCCPLLIASTICHSISISMLLRTMGIIFRLRLRFLYFSLADSFALFFWSFIKHSLWLFYKSRFSVLVHRKPAFHVLPNILSGPGNRDRDRYRESTLSIQSSLLPTDAFQALRPNQFVPLSVPFEIHGYVSYEKRTERTQPDYQADIGIQGGLDIPSP